MNVHASLGLSILLGTAGCTGGGGTIGSMTDGGAAPSASLADGSTATTSPAPIPGSGLVVDRVAFDLLPEWGLGGVSYVPTPIVLFVGGAACDCTNEDLTTLDLDELRQRRPTAMATWREQNGVVEIKWNDEWRKIAFTTGARPLGASWRVAGRYQRMSGVGTSPEPTVVSTKTISFGTDGRFALESNVAANAPNVSAQDAARYQGTYAVDGWVMTLTFDAGTTARYSALVAANDAAEDVMWLAGASYQKL